MKILEDLGIFYRDFITRFVWGLLGNVLEDASATIGALMNKLGCWERFSMQG